MDWFDRKQKVVQALIARGFREIDVFILDSDGAMKPVLTWPGERQKMGEFDTVLKAIQEASDSESLYLDERLV